MSKHPLENANLSSTEIDFPLEQLVLAAKKQGCLLVDDLLIAIPEAERNMGDVC
jgi:hypothetical protein